jgi:hypothetical protein
MLAARVEQKNEMTKDDKKWRDAPLTKKAPYKPDGEIIEQPFRDRITAALRMPAAAAIASAQGALRP